MANEKQIEKALDNLYKAAVKYVALCGGSISVAGGVKVIRFAGNLKYNWTLGISCTGNPPVEQSAQQSSAGELVGEHIQ
jgi:hypothetical protein